MRGRLGRAGAAEPGPSGRLGGGGTGVWAGAGAGTGAGRGAPGRPNPPTSSSFQVRALQAAGAGVRVGSDPAEGDRTAREGEDLLHQLIRGQFTGGLRSNKSFAVAVH